MQVEITGFENRRVETITVDGVTLERDKDVYGNRSIFFYGDVVIKVDRPGRYQGWNEWILWTEELEPDERQFFAPCLAFGSYEHDYQVGTWVAQERLEFAENPEVSSLDYERLAPLAHDYDFYDGLQARYVVDGRPVIYDYGAYQNTHASDRPSPSGKNFRQIA